MKKVLFALLLPLFLPLFLVAHTALPADAAQQCAYEDENGNTRYANHGDRKTFTDGTFTCNDGEWQQ